MWPYASNSKSLQSNPKSFLTFATSNVLEFLVFDVLNAKNLAIRTPDTSAQRVWELIGSTVLTSKSLLTHPEGNFQNISPSF